VSFYSHAYKKSKFLCMEFDCLFVRCFILAAYCHVVGIQDIFGLDSRGSILSRGKICLFFVLSRPALEPTQPLVHWVSGALSSEMGRPERDADHSPSVWCPGQEWWSICLHEAHALLYTYLWRLICKHVDPKWLIRRLFRCWREICFITEQVTNKAKWI
jgi:hypothetical protein